MLPLVRYRFELTVTQPLYLPPFAGSTIRGIFGGALRGIACMTKQPTCDGCSLLQSCPYASVFEPRPPNDSGNLLQNFSQIPRPYVIEPPEWGERTYQTGETLSFHLVLAGKALAQLPLIAWAIHRAFARGRVGKLSGAAELQRVIAYTHDGEVTVLKDLQSSVIEHNTTLPSAPVQQASSVRLHFNAPLRLQVNGRRATSEEFTPRRLLATLIRRVSLVQQFYGEQALEADYTELADAANLLEQNKELRWRDWSRFSSRQQKKMDLGGVLGSWELRGTLTPFIPFLHVGQWLHVGKEATFGLGGYRLEWNPNA